MTVSLVGLSCQILDIKQLCHPLVVIIYHLIFIFFILFLGITWTCHQRLYTENSVCTSWQRIALHWCWCSLQSHFLSVLLFVSHAKKLKIPQVLSISKTYDAQTSTWQWLPPTPPNPTRRGCVSLCTALLCLPPSHIHTQMPFARIVISFLFYFWILNWIKNLKAKWQSQLISDNLYSKYLILWPL